MQTTDQEQYWCHTCNSTTSVIPKEDGELTCSVCSGEYVEIIDPNDNPASFTQNQESEQKNPQPRLPPIVQQLVQNFPGSNVQIHVYNNSGNSNAALSQLLSSNNPFQNFMEMFNMNGNNLADYGIGQSIQEIANQLMSISGPSGPPPAAKTAIDSLPEINVDEEMIQKDKSCGVCKEDFIFDETVKKMPCGHIFHENCIVPWLNLHNTCALCRYQLPPVEPTPPNQPPQPTQTPPQTQNPTYQSYFI